MAQKLICRHNMNILNALTDTKTRTPAGYALLGLLFIQLFVIVVLPNHWQSLFYDICLSIIILVLGFTLIKWKKGLILLLVTLVTLEYISKFFNLDMLNTVVLLFDILLLIIVIAIYILQTSQAKKVNASVILQSINGYLLLALASSLLIIIILRYDAGAFSFPDSYDSVNLKLGEAQYLGLVTISTLGYGDIIPLAPIARSVTTLIAVSGQLYIAIIIALLVGKFTNLNNR